LSSKIEFVGGASSLGVTPHVASSTFNYQPQLGLD
jgi:hypothetical protein